MSISEKIITIKTTKFSYIRPCLHDGRYIGCKRYIGRSWSQSSNLDKIGKVKNACIFMKIFFIKYTYTYI